MSTKNQCQCAAHGCPMLGTMSTSTAGSDEWWCFLHFGRDAVQLQKLTVEINRREWLAKAITDIRMHCHTEAWPSVFKAVKHDFAMAQRNDLQHGGNESVWKWIARLESELQAMCQATFVRPPKQERIQEDSFTRVQFDASVPA